MVKKVFLWLGLVLLVGIGLWLYISLEPVKLVIFAGGGSVKNYIDSTWHINLNEPKSCKIPKSVYINVPSEYGWTLLKEEIERFGNNSNPRDFLYVCLSAGPIVEDSLYKIGFKDEYKRYARICEYHIGDDPLMVYCGEAFFNAKDVQEKDYFRFVSKLKDVIEKFKADSNSKVKDEQSQKMSGKIYATSRRSGTLRKYQEILHVNFDTISNTLFYETDSIKDSDNAIVLGSKYYKPGNLKNENNWFYLYNVEQIETPLYIYFVVFAKEGYKLDKQIVKFLNTIDVSIHGEIKDKIKENDILIHLNDN